MLKHVRDSDSAAPASWRTRRRRTALLTAAIAAGCGLAAAAGGWVLAQQAPVAAPWALGAGGMGLLGLLALGQRLSARPRASAVLGAALLGLTVACGYRVAAAVPERPTANPQAAPNAVIIQRVKRIAEDLREARMTKDGLTPAGGELQVFLKRQPGEPPTFENPFGGPRQGTTQLLPATGSPLPRAAELVRGREPVALGTKLGPGEVAAPGRPYTLRTWGAIAYDRDPVSGEYVLYGIGRQGDQAVLVHAVRGPR